MKLDIYQVDAFAEKAFEGNPAAVVPLDHWPDDVLMQKIAMENNLSETAFFVRQDPASPASEAFYHIRWFTPTFEIDLCGHATLASAYVIKNFIQPHVHEIIFSTEKAGELRTIVKDGRYTLDFPARMPQATDVPPKLLQSLGVTNPVEVLRSRDCFVVLPNEEAVLNVEPDFSLMGEIETVGVIITARGHGTDVVSRCFYPSAGIPEDPVTGSAHCNIIPYWAGKMGKNKLSCYQASSRGGKLECELAGDRVLMTGECVLFMKGEITIDQ